jgi:hypothetical protein
LFALYKEKGSCWSTIAQEFPGRNENQVKNRFYSTLRRLATKESAAVNTNAQELFPKTKKRDLLKYVDEAMVDGHSCSSKRGRKRKLKAIDNDNDEAEQFSLESVKEEEKQENPQIQVIEDKVTLIAKNNQTLMMLDQKISDKPVMNELDGENLAKAMEELKQLLSLKDNIASLLNSTQEVLQTYTSKDEKSIV